MSKRDYHHRSLKCKNTRVCRYVAPPAPGECYYNTLMLWLCFIIECGIAHFRCAMHVFKVRASSSSPQFYLYIRGGRQKLPSAEADPLGYLCDKFHFFMASIAELAHIKNCVLNHPPNLSDAPGTEVFASEYFRSLIFPSRSTCNAQHGTGT